MKYWSVVEAVERFSRTSGIYCVVNFITGMKYIGKSTNVGSRIRTHFIVGSKRKNHRQWFYRSIAKNGASSFGVALLKKAPADQQDALEVLLIQKHRTTHPNGFNCTFGGTGGATNVGFSEKQRLEHRRRSKRIGLAYHDRVRSDPALVEKHRKIGADSMANLLKTPGFLERRNASVSKSLSKPVRVFDGEETREYSCIQMAARMELVSESSVSRCVRGLIEADANGNEWEYVQ